MVAGGMPYKKITGEIAVKDGIASTTDLFVDSDAINISAVGKIDMVHDQLDLNIGVQPLQTVDMDTGEADQAVRERSDVCAVPAAAVVGEQMVALSLAGEFQRKFGGDTVSELAAAVAGYRQSVAERLAKR